MEEELEDDGEEGDDVIESLAASEEASAGAREADCDIIKGLEGVPTEQRGR